MLAIIILVSEEIRVSQLSWWNQQSVQNQVTRCMSDTAKLSLVAGSWLFHDDDDDDANLWQLGLFAQIWRCVSRFIIIVKGVYVCNDNFAKFSPLAPIKIFRLNLPTRHITFAISAHNQACCLHGSIRIARIKFAIKLVFHRWINAATDDKIYRALDGLGFFVKSLKTRDLYTCSM